MFSTSVFKRCLSKYSFDVQEIKGLMQMQLDGYSRHTKGIDRRVRLETTMKKFA